MKETTNYKIRKPDPTDFFNIEEHFNHNADVIDNAIHNVETKLNNIDTTAEKTTLKDTGNNYNSNNVEGALIEIAEDISASKTSILDLEKKTTTNSTDISNLKSKVDRGQNHKLTEDDGRYIQIRDIGNVDTLGLGWFNLFNAKGTLPSGYSHNDNDFLVENKGVGNDWIRQILYDVRSEKSFIRMKLNGSWSDWRSL